jgi:hypothetical protein
LLAMSAMVGRAIRAPPLPRCPLDSGFYDVDSAGAIPVYHLRRIPCVVVV